MILEHCFSIDWLNNISRVQRYKNKVLAEKSIRAFDLLDNLVQTDLDFIFKGGTSLILHLPEIQRLSIDIDIVTGASKDKINETVQKVAESSRFKRSEENDRGERGLPNRRHFKFFYDSAVDGREEYVLLDVVEEASWDLATVELPVEMSFLEVEDPSIVRVPTVESLIGDKLTAFAPHTLGVPYQGKNGNPQESQVAKQLFDVGALTPEIKDMRAMAQAYQRSYEMENGYRDRSFTKEEVLIDTQNGALDTCGNSLRNYNLLHDDNDKLQTGIKNLQNHLVNAQFNQNIGAKIAAAKVFMLTQHLSHETEIDPALLKYLQDNHLGWIKQLSLPENMNMMNKLKKSVPEAFYYLALGSGLRP